MVSHLQHLLSYEFYMNSIVFSLNWYKMAIYYNLDLGFPDYDDIKNLHTFVGSVYFLFCKMCFYSHLTVEKTSAQRSQVPCLRLHTYPRQAWTSNSALSKLRTFVYLPPGTPSLVHGAFFF
jgi:hypothetical protein